MKKIKSLTILFIALTAIVFTSCSNMKLASDIAGTWKTDIEEENEGMTLKGDWYLNFETTDRVFSQKGNAIEVFAGTLSTPDGSEVDISFYVEGTWELKDGDMYIERDPGSLKVKFDVDEALKDEFTKEIRKEIKKDDDDPYEDVEVDGDKMSLKDPDLGRVRFHKSDKDIEKVFKKSGDDSSNDDSSIAETDSSYNTNNSMSEGSGSDGDLSSSDESAISQVVSKWDELHNDNNIDEVNDVFAPTVEFYGQNLSRSDVATKIAQLCNSIPDYHQDSHDLSYQVLDNGDVNVEFTKSTVAKGRSHDYPSYLVLKRSSNDYGWSIIKESDKVTDRNLQK